MSDADTPAALALALADASPRSILQRAIELDGEGLAISFAGAEDVLILEYARQLGSVPRVFTIDTGRLHPETYRYIAEVGEHFGISIEVCMADAGPVAELVSKKGLFSFYEDGHEECCRLRKVAPLARRLADLRAWVTGQRRDQSPDTRARLPVVEVDPRHVGRDGAPLRKWNPLANTSSSEVWEAIRAFDVPHNPLHARGMISIGCEPCTRAVLPGEHERAGRWWWEDDTKRECGLHRRPDAT